MGPLAAARGDDGTPVVAGGREAELRLRLVPLHNDKVRGHSSRRAEPERRTVNADTYGLRDRRRDRSRHPQRHSMASRNAVAARAERVFCRVHPGDARDVHFGLGQRISPGHLIGFQTGALSAGLSRPRPFSETFPIERARSENLKLPA
jgi:hypothetical protein